VEVPPEDRGRIQSPKYVLNKNRTMDNVHKHSSCIYKHEYQNNISVMDIAIVFKSLELFLKNIP
jgi:hypothetical protein